MKYLEISDSTTLLQLINLLGERNVDSVLTANGLTRTPHVGKALHDKCNEINNDPNKPPITGQIMMPILNRFTQDSDIFEFAALAGAETWNVLHAINTFPNKLRIPEYITIPDSVNVMGNGQPVVKSIYDAVSTTLENSYPEINPIIDESIFSTYSVIQNASIDTSTPIRKHPFQWFKIPWGKISLYSSIANYAVDFPVYPEPFEDYRQANYTTMPDMLYTYEPWQIYQNSGPRSNTYTFHMHRDMWSGDHRDGQCLKLIQFCEANCFAEYAGAAVNTALVTLYINGKPFITGIMTNVKKSWDGPIGLDGWYLEVTLELSITEVATAPLNYNHLQPNVNFSNTAGSSNISGPKNKVDLMR